MVIALFAAPVVAQQSLDAMVDRELPQLVNTYKMLHAAPELSHYEVKTSAFLAEQLRALGYDVTENVGKYENAQWKGHGVVAVMKNGAGPTVLVRSDIDALPVEEMTGLPYASTVKTKNDAGQEVSVMHACGHDVHITSLIGTATMLARLKRPMARNAGADWPAGGRDNRWRQSDAGRRAIFAHSET
jgi:hippurate hydrolase